MKEPGTQARCPVQSERSGTTLILSIDRPHRRNALSRETVVLLRDLVDEASRDPGVRAVVLSSRDPRVFISGGDLHEFAALLDDPSGARKVSDLGCLPRSIEQCAVPVIAAVQGATLGGGCELVVACDLVVAEAGATFTFRQAAMGLSTGWGGGTRLVARVGPMRAAQLLLTGDTVGAREALALGLIAEVAPAGEGLSLALALAERIARHPRDAVAGIKRMLQQVRVRDRVEAFEAEAEVFARLWGGEGHRAAMARFLGAGRREPARGDPRGDPCGDGKGTLTDSRC